LPAKKDLKRISQPVFLFVSRCLFRAGIVQMESKTNDPSLTSRFLIAGLACLALGLHFYTMNDQIGTAIYSVASAFSLLVASVQCLKQG
jgi:hypothetical protein